MTVIDRYIVRTILGAVGLVMLVLLTLDGLFIFIGQQDDIGVGSYGSAGALRFVALNLPEQAFGLLPIGTLVGTLLGLGGLARGSELTVMRASGISVRRIAGSALMAGMLLMIAAAFLGEVVATPLQLAARQEKAFAKFSNVSFAGAGGAWLRDGNLIVNVVSQTSEQVFGGMFVYELSAAHELEAIGHASTATSGGTGRSWDLTDYAESRFTPGRVLAQHLPQKRIQSRLGAEFLSVAMAAPTDLNGRTLHRLIRHLSANGLDVRNYVFAFWSRIARTLATAVFVLLAVPFVFGSLRAAGTGARTMIGLLLGIAFFLAQQMLESGALVFDLDPVLVAWLPTGLMAVLAVALIARTR
ncbi:MAG: LPS export ABC transporter permease LptG [Gammaproteobacteria bacterium]|nr:LPS export ABC transporter permease LptG [Gammaproteobacteria bacterium]